MKIINIEYIPILKLYHENQGRLSFTSLVSTMDSFVFLDDHLERLLSGYVCIFGHLPNGENKLSLIERLKTELVQQFSSEHVYRIVMTEDMIYLSKIPHRPNPIELSVKVMPLELKSNLFPSCVKNGDYQKSFKNLEDAKSLGFDDVIFFAENNLVTEATTSNIFVVTKFGKIVTPKDSQIVLDGITRKNLIKYLLNNKFEIEIRDVSLNELLEAKEIWLSNAVQGLRFVSNINATPLSRNASLFEKVSLAFGRFGEKLNGK